MTMEAPRRPPAIGAPTESGCTRLIASGIDEAINADVQRMNYPAYAREVEQTFVDRATAQVDAGTSPPLDELFLPDKLAVEAVAELTIERNEARSTIAATALNRSTAEKDLAKLVSPWRPEIRALIGVGLVGMTVLSVIAVGLLLAPSIDYFFLRDYTESIDESAGAAQVSAELARWTAFGTAAALLFSQTLAVILTWGRLNRLVKLTFLVADLLFSLSFALVRCGEQLTFQSLAVSGFELAVLVVQSLALMGAAVVLQWDGERSDAYRTKAAEALRSAREEERAHAALVVAEERRYAQVQALEARVNESRRQEPHRQLVAATATAAYRVSIAAQMSREATVARTATSTIIEEHLQQEGQRLEQLSNGTNGAAPRGQ